MPSDDEKLVAERIWDLIFSKGPRGVIADEVLAAFPELGHTTVTARIYGLKHANLIVRHPESLVRKTRKGRTAEVWVVRRGVKFDPKKYREPKVSMTKPRDPPPETCKHRHLTEGEHELLAAARRYGELTTKNEHEIDDVLNTLFDTIVRVYPAKKEKA